MGGTIAFYTYSVNAPAIIKPTYANSPSPPGHRQLQAEPAVT